MYILSCSRTIWCYLVCMKLYLSCISWEPWGQLLLYMRVWKNSCNKFPHIAVTMPEIIVETSQLCFDNGREGVLLALASPWACCRLFLCYHSELLSMLVILCSPTTNILQVSFVLLFIFWRKFWEWLEFEFSNWIWNFTLLFQCNWYG